MSTYIHFAQRSAIGSFHGTLSNQTAPEIAAQVISQSFKNSSIPKEDVEEVLIGNVLSAGIGQAPARQAALKAGIQENVPCTTISKVCGSGLKSIMLADALIRAKEAEIILAGGMESMSQSPYLVPKLRTGLRLGHGEILDSMIKDGLWDAYNNFHMGNAAELCASKYELSREQQDEYARTSYKRAMEAAKQGFFKDEIVPIMINSKKGVTSFVEDEEIQKVDFEKFSQLKPAFDKNGTITAANASSLSDGAAMVLLVSESIVNKRKLKPIARIVAQAQAAQDPKWFSTAPAASIEKLLKKCSLKIEDIDLWEINEAFAAVALVNQKLLSISADKLNIYGGAVALGHPIGASGTRILVTLAHALKRHGKRYGIASLCIGGGEAVSMLIENLHV